MKNLALVLAITFATYLGYHICIWMICILNGKQTLTNAQVKLTKQFLYFIIIVLILTLKI